MLWTECLCPLKIHMLKPNRQCDGIKRWGPLGMIKSWGWNPHEWDLCPYEIDPESSLTPLPCEDTVRGHSCMNQEVGPCQTQNLPVPWSWSSQPPEPWEINVCCFWLIQSMVFCYRGPNRLRYLEITPFFLFSWRKLVNLVFKALF